MIWLTLSSEIAFEIIRTLRSSNVASVVERAIPLMQYDPVQRLPAEITSEVFSYLEAPTLLTASLTCKAWRQRILDSQLWKKLYISQGWGVDNIAIGALERRVMRSVSGRSHFTAHQRDSAIDVSEPKQKRRAISSWLDDRQRSIQMSPMPMDTEVSRWNEQHGQVEADVGVAHGEAQTSDVDQEMHDVSIPFKSDRQPSIRSNKRSSRDETVGTLDTSTLVPVIKQHSATSVGHSHLDPPLKPSLTMLSPSGRPRVDWLYLYKQRRRLEENWNTGRYINYQLPQVGFEHEGHRQCVYTIQFFGKWLVSGSRDHTMRVWDLETRRLRGTPLTGHSQSVLCLQFDPTPEEDVIISGSSDTTVKVWRFSTGQLLHTLQAHRESVLNIRFDHRYLVTCSKDELIKVWNRQELAATSPDYPRINHRSNAQIPSYIVDINMYRKNPLDLETKIANRTIRTLQPYSLLMQLEGHRAAVNAIQIDGDRIVSASGDRNIKIWDIKDGRSLATLIGHHKGIACVQIDNKRIVSGSSDNTIRIYDNATGAEVACLKGHENLVRTVQAGFGDTPGNDEDLRQQAAMVDREWREAFRRAEIGRETAQSRRRSRHSTMGLREVHDISAVGAALPPGGGGSRWGRIVSGSYDEQIIIWRKDSDGRRWIPSHRLSHSEASQLATANGVNEARAREREQLGERGTAPSGSSSAPPDVPGNSSAVAATTTSVAFVDPSLQLQGAVPGAHQAMHQLQHHAQLMNQALQQGQAPFNVTNQQQPLPPLQGGHNGHPHAHAIQPVAVHGHGHTSASHRVFKLQFDARKIICCSQDPRIVIWDFANGDRELEETSQFFVGPT